MVPPSTNSPTDRPPESDRKTDRAKTRRRRKRADTTRAIKMEPHTPMFGGEAVNPIRDAGTPMTGGEGKRLRTEPGTPMVGGESKQVSETNADRTDESAAENGR